jgi:hypothetical protein
MMLPTRSRRAPLIGLLGVVLFGASAVAQGGAPADSGLTRAQLQARARLADSLHRTNEGLRVRSRLANGDFQVGDRIIAVYEGIGGVGTRRTDTLVVQSGRILRMGQPFGDMNLSGRLRSELGDSLTARVNKYFRNVTVQATSLLRVAISGAVRLPGFYYVPTDIPFSDLIMRAGGQDPSSDLAKVTVKQGEREIMSRQETQAALRDGSTLEMLSLQPGDEVVVGARSSNRWPMILGYGIPLITAIAIPLIISR